MKSRVHPTYKAKRSDRLTIVPSKCVSTRQGGRRHRDRGLTPCGVRPGCASAEFEPPGRDERQCNGFPARSQQRPSRSGSCSTTSKCSITNDAGTRRLARSVQRPLNFARTKRAWTGRAIEVVVVGRDPVRLRAAERVLTGWPRAPAEDACGDTHKQN